MGKHNLLLGVAVLGLALCRASSASVVAYWRFEGAPGTGDSGATGGIIDSSGNGNNGTAFNGPVYTSNVPATTLPLSGLTDNTALSFDGSSQRIFVPDNTDLRLTHSMTIEAYIYSQPLLSGNGDGNVVFRGDDTSGFDPYRLTVGYSNGQDNSISFLVTNAANQIATVTANIPANQWIHVAGTLDDATGTMSIYVNGVLQNSITTTIRPYATLTGANPGMGIGALQDAIPALGTEYFHGMIDEVRISNTALTPAQFLDAGTVPEPATVSLCSLAAIPLLLRRRAK